MYRKFVDAVKVPVLANMTEFGATPCYTLDELRNAGVAMALYPLSAFRAMNKAAENVYRRSAATAPRRTWSTRCRRAELYDRIGYHDFEQKLDALFAQGKGR
jgi:methylisocitrate lyase